LPRRGETRFNLFVSVLPPLSSLTRDELLQLVGQLLGEVAGRGCYPKGMSILKLQQQNVAAPALSLF
jgi:hypothetical protein